MAYKIFSILGLVIDGIGIFLLLQNEIKNHQISEAQSEGHNKEDELWNNENIKQGRGLRMFNKKSTVLRIMHNHQNSVWYSKTGLRLLILGFALQIIGIILT